MSGEVARFWMRKSRKMHLIPDVCSCHVLRNLAVAVCKIGDVCCLPAPAHQPFSSNSLGLSAPEEADSRNVCALGTLKLGYEGIFKICPFVASLKNLFELLILYKFFHAFIHVYSPGTWADNPLGTKFWCHQCYIPSPKVNGPLVPEKKSFKGLLPYMGLAAILVMWPRPPAPPNKLSFPRPMEAPYKIWFRLTQQFLRRCSKTVDTWSLPIL